MSQLGLFLVYFFGAIWLGDLVYLFTLYLAITIKEIRDYVKKNGWVSHKVMKPQ
jgi:hypothetical protein